MFLILKSEHRRWNENVMERMGIPTAVTRRAGFIVDKRIQRNNSTKIVIFICLTGGNEKTK